MSVAEAGPVGPMHPVRIRLAAQGDGVPVVEIPDELEFAVLREWLRQRLPEQVEIVGGRTVRLDLGTRAIQLFDLRRLVNLLRDEFSIDVTGVYVESEEVWSYAERELKLRLFEREVAPEISLDADNAVDVDDEAESSDDDEPELDEDAQDTEVASEGEASEEDAPEAPLATVAEVASDADTEAPAPERTVPGPRIETPKNDPLDELLGRGEPAGSRVHHVHRTLRSGTSIRFDGDVLVFGDMNPGAEIIATGNVIVFGSLRGLVHAGASGDESTLIIGFDLRPTQLRIGRKIAMAPNEDAPSGVDPTVARVRDGKIVLEPYRTRSTR